ncbi:MAG: hypothetical protein NTW21_31035 [Verrucomicrobia bacterium]|nr:hypothetical protein [Verrucomicrobiota bacterium]
MPRDSIEVAKAHPQTTFIFAHGLFMLEDDEGLAKLAGIFDQLEGFKLPDPVLNHIHYWNAVRLIPRVRQVLEARNFKIGYELGNFKCDRLPPDVTVNKLTLGSGQPADLTGTLGSLTGNLVAEIAGKTYSGIDNLDGTWKLPADKLAGRPAGTYDVKVTATNSIGLVRTDSTTNELTVAASAGKSQPTK